MCGPHEQSGAKGDMDMVDRVLCAAQRGFGWSNSTNKVLTWNLLNKINDCAILSQSGERIMEFFCEQKSCDEGNRFRNT